MNTILPASAAAKPVRKSAPPSAWRPLALGAAVLLSACAMEPPPPIQYVDETPWVELQTHLPPFPRQADLLRFYVGPLTANRFFVDANSVSVGSDGVVRYTLYIRSSAGAVNVSYEGMRCIAARLKVYAFGRDDHTWALAREPRWERIRLNDASDYHSTLYRDFFCPGGSIVGSSWEAVNALKQGVNPRAVNY